MVGVLRVANRVTDKVAGWRYYARAVIARACSLLRKNILAGLGITATMLRVSFGSFTMNGVRGRCC